MFHFPRAAGVKVMKTETVVGGQFEERWTSRKQPPWEQDHCLARCE